MIKSGGYVTKKYLDETLDKKFTTFKKGITTELYDIKDEIMSELKKNRENDESHQFSHMRVMTTHKILTLE